MIVDFRQLGDGARLEFDLCVVGAGAAGITICREFFGTQVQVCLIESGALDFESKTQSLYEGENIGLAYSSLDSCRLRYFGGTTNHWSGWCTTLSEIDFDERQWIPHSGWPLSKADLDPFYERAQLVCNLGPYRYEDNVWRLLDIDAPQFDNERIRSRFWQIPPPTRFGKIYRDEFIKSRNVRVFLHANVTELHANHSLSIIDSVEVATLDGKKGRVHAKVFVLACGGIENPRLLLLSNKIAPNGLGNAHDLVGRFFMEHAEARFGAILAPNPIDILRTFWMHWHEGIPYLPTLCTGSALQHREEILNCGVMVLYEPDPDSGLRLAREAWNDLKRGRVPDDLDEDILQLIMDLDIIASNVYRRFIEGQEPIEPPKLIFTQFSCEQAPNPQSRVTLSHDRDALGLNRVQLDWQLTMLERRSVEVFAKIIGAEFARLEIARFRIFDWLLNNDVTWPSTLSWGNHHMGTTRMGNDSKSAVVDKNCRLYDTNNLYVAGSSVFPTSGYANPTLTIVALSLRLADQLKLSFS